MVALWLLGSALAARPAGASPGAVAIEIDSRAEAVVDARVTRRLVRLELADVTVPPPLGQREAALFVRVLFAGQGELTVELWERGILYGARQVEIGAESGSLLQRRVALAAAELARELSDTRDDEATARAQERQRKLTAERAARERTLDGPRALRVGVAGSWAERLALLGPLLAAEIHVHRATRLDVDMTLGHGLARSGVVAESLSLGFGPARRVVLAARWDLDLALRAAASLLVLPGARAVDGIADEHETWSASAEGRARLEPRLSRAVRLVLGLGGGLLLRPVPLTPQNSSEKRIEGPFVSAELGLVLTPF